MKFKNVLMSLTLLAGACFSSQVLGEANPYKDHTPEELFEIRRRAEDQLGYNAYQLARAGYNSPMLLNDTREDDQWVKEVDAEIKNRKLSAQAKNEAKKQAQTNYEKLVGSTYRTDNLVDLDDTEFKSKQNEIANPPVFKGEYGAAAETYFKGLKDNIAKAQIIRDAKKAKEKAESKAAQEARQAMQKAYIEKNGLNKKNAETLITAFAKRQGEKKSIDPMTLVVAFNDALMETLDKNGKIRTEDRGVIFYNAIALFRYILSKDSTGDEKKRTTMKTELGNVLRLNGFDDSEVIVAQKEAKL